MSGTMTFRNRYKQVQTKLLSALNAQRTYYTKLSIIPLQGTDSQRAAARCLTSQAKPNGGGRGGVSVWSQFSIITIQYQRYELILYWQYWGYSFLVKCHKLDEQLTSNDSPIHDSFSFSQNIFLKNVLGKFYYSNMQQLFSYSSSS